MPVRRRRRRCQWLPLPPDCLKISSNKHKTTTTHHATGSGGEAAAIMTNVSACRKQLHEPDSQKLVWRDHPCPPRSIRRMSRTHRKSCVKCAGSTGASDAGATPQLAGSCKLDGACSWPPSKGLSSILLLACAAAEAGSSGACPWRAIRMP